MSSLCEVLKTSIAERHSNLFANMPSGCIVIDLSGDIIDVNPAALQILGSPSVSDTRDINMLTYQPLVDVGVSELVKRALCGEKIADDVSYLTKWNKHITVRFTAVPIYDGDFVCLVMIMMEDLSGYNTLKSELERNNKLLKTVIDAIPSLIWLKDADGRYLFTNKSFDEFNAFLSTDPIGKTDFEIWPIEQAEKFTMEDTLAQECEYPIEKTDTVLHPVLGEKHYKTLKIGVCDELNNLIGTVGVSCDVSRQYEQDKILADALKELTSSLNGNTYVK